MKKLTKTMKSIIIASISLVCVAAIVLGCVFGFKKKGEKTPNGPSQQEIFLASQQKFEDAVNANLSDAEYSTIDLSRFDAIVGENKVVAFDDSFVVVENADGNQDACKTQRKHQNFPLPKCRSVFLA